MKRLDFYGNKLLFCTKEEFDKLTVEQMEGVDTAFDAMTSNKVPISYINFDFINNDLSCANVCINAMFSLLKCLHTNDICRLIDLNGTIACKRFYFLYRINRDKSIKLILDQENKIITHIGHATLYDIGNQHWVSEKGNAHNIPKDKSVNIHEYYDVIVNENSVECTVDFFERGVGKTQACGSGAFCLGMHLFKIHGKEVVVKTENGDKYYVKDNTISVEI